MIRYLAPTFTFLLGLGIGIAATYGPTRAKWTDLGRNTGEIQGQGAIMRDLCTFARPGKPPEETDYHLDVKASRLSVVREGDALAIYCEE